MKYGPTIKGPAGANKPPCRGCWLTMVDSFPVRTEHPQSLYQAREDGTFLRINVVELQMMLQSSSIKKILHTFFKELYYKNHRKMHLAPPRKVLAVT